MKTLTFAAAVLALGVVVFGAFVRLSDAGLSCPDWPGCYGNLAVTKDQGDAYPERPLDPKRAWIEMTHRYLAGILGLVIFALAIAAWRRETQRGPATALAVLVLVQALLGMWTVTLLLKPVVVTLHLLGGMATLALACWIAMVESGKAIAWNRTPLRAGAIIGLALLFAQIALGGWVSSHNAGLACADFPLCEGSLIPTMDFASAFSLENGRAKDSLVAIQWTHRIGAFVVLAYLSWLSVRAMHFVPAVAAGLLLLVWLQAGIGIANVYLRLPLVLAVAHNAVAALLLIAMVVLNFRLRRHPARPPGSK
ncbi:MAG: COX15/CtaA family protein [Burkholderiales bacterium]